MKLTSSRPAVRLPVTRERSVIARYAAWIAAVTLVGGLAAGAWSYHRAVTYAATSKVLVGSQVFPAGNAQPPDMGTEREIAISADVLTDAARHVGIPATTLRSALSVVAPANTRVLSIRATAPTAAAAAARAQAVADAFVRFHAVVGPAPAPGRARGSAGTQLATVISPPRLPTAPAGPNHVAAILLGLIAGLAVGLGSAVLRDRLDDRVRGLPALEATLGRPVLAVVPDARGYRDGRRATGSPDPRSSQAYEFAVARILHEMRTRPCPLVVVSSVVDAELPSSVAEHLAASCSRLGRRPALVVAPVRAPSGVGPDALLASVEDARKDHDVVVVATGPCLTNPLSLAVADAANCLIIAERIPQLGQAEAEAAGQLLADLDADVVAVVAVTSRRGGWRRSRSTQVPVSSVGDPPARAGAATTSARGSA